MKKKLLAWRTTAVLTGAVTLVAGVAALAPAASVAKSATKCANKSIKIKTESTPPQTLSVPVKAITTEGGVSCATAYKVIAGAVSGHPVAGYKTAIGKFEAPEGLVPEIAVKGSKKIKFAVQGG
jgi:hypothetical protein